MLGHRRLLGSTRTFKRIISELEGICDEKQSALAALVAQQRRLRGREAATRAAVAQREALWALMERWEAAQGRRGAAGRDDDAARAAGTTPAPLQHQELAAAAQQLLRWGAQAFNACARDDLDPDQAASFDLNWTFEGAAALLDSDISAESIATVFANHVNRCRHLY
jgi:hypothetical protein